MAAAATGAVATATWLGGVGAPGHGKSDLKNVENVAWMYRVDRGALTECDSKDVMMVRSCSTISFLRLRTSARSMLSKTRALRRLVRSSDQS